jgi:hypothetical protein
MSFEEIINRNCLGMMITIVEADRMNFSADNDYGAVFAVAFALQSKVRCYRKISQNSRH